MKLMALKSFKDLEKYQGFSNIKKKDLNVIMLSTWNRNKTYNILLSKFYLEYK